MYTLTRLVVVLLVVLPSVARAQAPAGRRLLYVATPGIRNYLEFGGHGLLVFDIDDGHRFVKRIATGGLDPRTVKPSNVKGICASAKTGRIYISVLHALMCLDIRTEKMLWERTYEGGCDRMSISPDGAFIYLPSLEKNHWNIIDAASGDLLAKITPNSGAHNTVVGLNGKAAYLAGLRSPHLTIADTATHRAARTCGPFSAPIRPFTINGRQTLIYANVNNLLGFEIGDLVTGKVLHQVRVPGFEMDMKKVKRHGCPSHGVGLTPDEKEVWVCDAAHQRLHIFDNTLMPPRYVQSIELREQPGWVTFSIDGRYAYPSTGEVIEARSRKIIATLADENGAAVHSEKMLEIIFDNDGKPLRNSDQFGLGRVRAQ
jgi:DNA-binding beta-propeller fold protein YncE